MVITAWRRYECLRSGNQSVIRVEESGLASSGASPALDELKSKPVRNGCLFLTLATRICRRCYPQCSWGQKIYQNGPLDRSIGPLEKSEPRYNPGCLVGLIGRPTGQTDPWVLSQRFSKCPFCYWPWTKTVLVIWSRKMESVGQTCCGGPVDLGNSLIAKFQYSHTEVEAGWKWIIQNSAWRIIPRSLDPSDWWANPYSGGEQWHQFVTSRTDIGDQAVI